MAHHGKYHLPQDSEFMKKIQAAHKEVREGFTPYPNGMMREDDEGAIGLAVGHENGRVKLLFAEPCAWIGMTPKQAMEMAGDLIKHARACGLRQSVSIEL